MPSPQHYLASVEFKSGPGNYSNTTEFDLFSSREAAEGWIADLLQDAMLEKDDFCRDDLPTAPGTLLHTKRAYDYAVKDGLVPSVLFHIQCAQPKTPDRALAHKASEAIDVRLSDPLWSTPGLAEALRRRTAYLHGGPTWNPDEEIIDFTWGDEQKLAEWALAQEEGKIASDRAPATTTLENAPRPPTQKLSQWAGPL